MAGARLVAFRVHRSRDPVAELAERLVEALAATDQATVGLSGGSSPIALFRLLREHYSDRIEWGTLHIFQVDERSVPPEHPDSNWGMIQRELLSHVKVAHVCRMEAERPDVVEELVATYRSDLSSGYRRFVSSVRREPPELPFAIAMHHVAARIIDWPTAELAAFWITQSPSCKSTKS